MNRDEVFSKVADELGFQPLVGESMSEQDADIFDAAPEQSEDADESEQDAHEPNVAEAKKFVYDDGDIRREFDTELELKSFESGVKSNEIGRLRREVEELRNRQAEQAKPAEKQPSREEYLSDLIGIAWPDTTAEQRQSPELQRIAEGMDRLLGAFKEQVMEPSLQRVTGDVEKMRAMTAEEKALAAHGITAAEANEYLEKRPGLKQLAVEDRVAVVADAIKGLRAGKKPAKDPLNAALDPDPANYVEPSARNPASDPSAAFEARLRGKSGKDLIREFGKAFEETGLGSDLTF